MELTATTQRNPAFAHSQEMQQICRGLFRRLNLNAFSFSRIYLDGSRAELWTDAYALEHSFFLKKHIDRVYTANLFNSQNFVFYDVAIEAFPSQMKQRISNQLNDQKEYFNHANCMFLIKYYQIYTEYFAFYTPVNHSNAFNDYLNHTDYLEKFAKYFHKRAKPFIDDADKNRLIHPWISEFTESSSFSSNLITEAKDFSLSQRENEIADLLGEGFSAKESAGILSISHRTVEKHLENIKKKLGFNKKAKLVSFLLSQHHEKA